MNNNDTDQQKVPQRRPMQIQMGGPGQIPMSGGKPRNFKASAIKLAGYCKKLIIPIVVSLILACLSAVPAIMGPSRIQRITDIIGDAIKSPVPYVDVQAIASIAVFILALHFCGFIVNSMQGVIMATITQKVSKSLRSDISLKINRLPLKYFDNTTFGNVLSRVTNDVDAIAQALNQSVTSMVSAVTLLIGLIIMMFVTNWVMAITAIMATALGFVLINLIVRKSQKYFSTLQRTLGDLNGIIEETYSGHSVIKVYNAGEKSKKTFAQTVEKHYNNAWKSQFVSGLMMPLTAFVGNLGFVAVCVMGGALAITGNASLGIIASFIIYARLLNMPLNNIAQGTASMQSAAAASERVFEFLAEPEMEDEAYKQLRLSGVRGDVIFDKINFGYSPDKTVIQNFSARAEAGQKVAIVGPTGAGKTTMVNLLMRFYEVNSGSIYIDGIDISQLKRENVREQFGMVLQDTWLFEGTIRANIAYSKLDASDAEIEAAAKAAGIDHFIRTLSDGYNTVLNDKANLSAGQKQLLTIARAMVENAPMLILDEATSNVDTRTEILIQEAMDKLTKGRTSFVIAHRLSTIKNADLILVMRDGDIVESGTHSELLSRNGFYTDLYNSQFEKLTA